MTKTKAALHIMQSLSEALYRERFHAYLHAQRLAKKHLPEFHSLVDSNLGRDKDWKEGVYRYVVELDEWGGTITDAESAVNDRDDLNAKLVKEVEHVTTLKERLIKGAQDRDDLSAKLKYVTDERDQLQSRIDAVKAAVSACVEVGR